MVRHLNKALLVILASLFLATESFAISLDNFETTTLSYSEQSDIHSIIQDEFGSNYRVADWNDIENLYSYYNENGLNWLDFSGFAPAMLTYNGSRWYSSGNHYGINWSLRPGASPHPGYYSIANLGQLHMGRGTMNYRILAYTDTPSVVPEPNTMLLPGIGLLSLAGIGKNRLKS